MMLFCAIVPITEIMCLLPLDNNVRSVIVPISPTLSSLFASFALYRKTIPYFLSYDTFYYYAFPIMFTHLKFITPV